MAHTIRHLSERTLNTDGRTHPKENALTMATAVFGVVALVTAFWPGLHLLSSWTGLAGLLTGGVSQMVSATTGERFVTVVGMGAAGVGFFLGMAHGGLFGGVVG
ncbi:hypothetical protein AQ490_07445 [Wenjunlia vitaminophila]|uniref:Uncharacterized protein n=1 Tax=Wenjunlia vitaminophila TaxID=76728 RepID=A0A0T6LN63_WENVI|nr:hypothetical protein [Wenjunlia vitaminophila]KRV47445.1 hypothetical protein AQ490_07445 [Wenjunlia vitaminophila]